MILRIWMEQQLPVDKRIVWVIKEVKSIGSIDWANEGNEEKYDKAWFFSLSTDCMIIWSKKGI